MTQKKKAALNHWADNLLNPDQGPGCVREEKHCGSSHWYKARVMHNIYGRATSDWISKAEQSPLVQRIYPGGWCSKLLPVQLPGDCVAGKHGFVSPSFISVPSAPRAVSGTEQGLDAIFLVNHWMFEYYAYIVYFWMTV